MHRAIARSYPACVMELAPTRLGRPIRLPALSQRYEPGVVIVGKYRLEAQLGEGGMGTVWLARNEALDAPVALKLIRSGMQREDTVERLLLEARVEARLKHPNIVRVFDFGQTELGDAFIVMEVLDGINLGDLLRQRGQLEAIEAVRLVLPVVGALCHAHESGVVHRDLKPENIFLDRGGLHAGTKLLDFGIAKLMGDESHPHFTEGGCLLGSPAYMAPEQARAAEDVDHRADIWAICVVLYEAISGSPVFTGEDYEVLRKILEDEVPRLEYSGPGGCALGDILSRGLAKEPSGRYQSMRELGTALGQWLCDLGESEDLDGNRISRRWGVIRVVGQPADPSAWSEAPPPPRLRLRRNLEMLELPPETAASFARALRTRRVSRRTASALRLAAASVFVLVVVLAPSRIPGEPAMSARMEPMRAVPLAEVRSIESPRATLPPDPPAPTRADAVSPRRRPREPSRQRSAPEAPTEAELGLKAAY